MALIYILEDDRNIREIESYSLKNSGYQVLEFEFARDFWKQMEQMLPDLILLDIMLPDGDGLEIVGKIRQRAEFRKIPVIMVTARTSEIDRVRGLDQGADDYLIKPFGVMEMLSRVRAMLRRMGRINEEKVLVLGNISLFSEKRKVTVAGEPCELTYKEFELLKLLLQNVGIVMSRDKLLERVWGIDYEGESRTLDMHIKTLRHKLGAEGSHIHTVRNVGYQLE